MAPESEPRSETESLLARVARGDKAAIEPLLSSQRGRLKKMILCRMDRRLAARFDPSDVVQETLAVAARDLDEYVRTRPLPFYVWLRRLAWQRLFDLQRRHLKASRRSVLREEPGISSSARNSLHDLARRIVWDGPAPGGALDRREQKRELAEALEKLEPTQRELLLLRYAEGLTLIEAAAAMGISVSAAKMRHLRAVQRLRALLINRNSHDED